MPVGAVHKKIRHPVTGKSLLRVFIQNVGWFEWNTAFKVYNHTENYAQLQVKQVVQIDFGQSKQEAYTPDEISRFVRSDACNCIRCGSFHIATARTSTEEGATLVRIVACNDCAEVWSETYTLTKVNNQDVRQ